VKRLAAVAIVLWLVPLAVSVPGAKEPSSAGDRAVQRFLTASDEPPLTTYRAIRYFEGRNGRFGVAATMTAVTELSPSTGFTYTVLEEHGSEYIRNRVFHALLENEKKILAEATPGRYAFTPENYDLGEWQASDEGLVRLLVKPRRREVGFIEGNLVLTAGTGDLVRIEGRLAKTPSFWTTRVEFVREYARIAGVRVPVRVDSTANVRVAGASKLSMVYEYEMVNGSRVTSGASGAMAHR
jgi:hypothetical protein